VAALSGRLLEYRNFDYFLRMRALSRKSFLTGVVPKSGRNMHKFRSEVFFCGLLALVAAPAIAQEQIPYSPYVERDFPLNVYFGDTHLHTNVSLDAYADGNIKLSPDDAYNFAKGAVTKGHDGLPVRISRPLDFLMVADHAEYLGYIPAIANSAPGEGLRATEAGARWGEMWDAGKNLEVFGELVIDISSNKPRLNAPDFDRSVWNDEIIAAAERHNDPGKFTAFIGYEYGSVPDGDNLHRVVVFRDGAEKTSQIVPFSAYKSNNPEDLWAYLADYEAKTGGQVLAIPHNANLSNGKLFALQDFVGNPLTREYAEERARWEPLYEVTQMKGDSEAHPVLSPTDEFANFERWDKANLIMLKPSTDETKPGEYARSALKNGLALEAELGVNPFKFGMIGSTDAHTSYANAEEDNYLGKYAAATPSPDRWKKIMGEGIPNRVVDMLEWQTSMSGLAAVWATENTREAIWDAMKRKEVYATTGPRMRVRVFGGFDLDPADATSNKLPDIGYAIGVPMGGDLPVAGDGDTPTFLVAALRDPDGANLDRIQMVKGWLDDKGKVHEQVYDIAVSDDRVIEDGKAVTPVGSTVDLETASYTNTIGDAILFAGWTDPDFDPAQRAFYYVRVLEIPTPRWTLFDVVRLGAEMPPEVPMVLQERAYTSPIWYTPEG
jgi:hypothetical protein